jgi:hypothetical protein
LLLLSRARLSRLLRHQSRRCTSRSPRRRPAQFSLPIPAAGFLCIDSNHNAHRVTIFFFCISDGVRWTDTEKRHCGIPKGSVQAFAKTTGLRVAIQCVLWYWVCAQHYIGVCASVHGLGARFHQKGVDRLIGLLLPTLKPECICIIREKPLTGQVPLLVTLVAACTLLHFVHVRHSVPPNRSALRLPFCVPCVLLLPIPVLVCVLCISV